MAVINITFDHLNTSLQIGDTISFVSAGAIQSNFLVSANSYVESFFFSDSMNSSNVLGTVIDIITSSNTVVIDAPQGSMGALASDYFFFTKNIQINQSSLKGYFLEAKMSNSSHKKAELFSLSSEVTPSSK